MLATGVGMSKVSGPATMVPAVRGVLASCHVLPPSGDPSTNTVPMKLEVFVSVTVVEPTTVTMLVALTPVPVKVVISWIYGHGWVGARRKCGEQTVGICSPEATKKGGSYGAYLALRA